MHTPATTFGRCPFLFTVGMSFDPLLERLDLYCATVCAISSRYYTERSELYSIAMHFAKSAAANALIDGWKSVEVCQAYILMSVYSLPSRKWEEAREWLYLGLAIRMATDLNLHLPSTTKVVNEQHERELLNRTRTWLICHNLVGYPFRVCVTLRYRARSNPVLGSVNVCPTRQAVHHSGRLDHSQLEGVVAPQQVQSSL